MNGVELEARRVGKTYAGREVVRGVDARFGPGRLYAVVGENGAGKSTLLKMLAGIVSPSDGEIRVAGTPLAPATPAEATARGVGLVHQHFSLVETLTGLENMMLGAEPAGRFGVLRPGPFQARVEQLMIESGLRVPLDRVTRSLSVAERQRLEILRVLVRGASALLLDEPTAILPQEAARELYTWLRTRVAAGATVVVVTHHLDEVAAFADHVTVMRGGEIRWSGAASERTVDELAEVALGARVSVPPPVPAEAHAPVVLSLRAASTGSTDEARTPLERVSLDVHRGEVVGVAGIDGNGQDALALALAGVVRMREGSLFVDGREVTGEGPEGRRKAGMEFVYADRHARGLIAAASVHDNAILGDRLSADEATVVARRLREGSVAPPLPQIEAGALSGGNQQKLVVQRALDRAPRVLVAAYPTRGVDAAAAAAIRARVAGAARAGTGVVVFSEDVAELRALAHRLVVLSQGRIVGAFAADVSEAELGRAMMGRGAP